MKKICVYHGFGMGDYIMYSGMVKEIADDYDVVYLMYTMPNYLESIQFLYEDTPNVVVTRSFPNGVKQLNLCPTEDYAQLVNSEFQFSFDLERNLEREQEFYDKVVKEIGEDYILVHWRPIDNPGRKLVELDRSLIESDLPQFNVHFGASKDENYGIVSSNIFDYCKLIENAKEIHFYEGGFSCLADRLLDNPKPKLVCHLYCRITGAGPINAKRRALEGKWHKNDWRYINEQKK